MNNLTVKQQYSLADVPASDWNALLRQSSPFLRYEFLRAMEADCLSTQLGWSPAYFMVYQDNKLVGAMPSYKKTNSFGEFVFDWSWASAYEQSGLNYYPKLVAAVPFTPVTGQRVLYQSDQDAQRIVDVLVNQIKQTVDAEYSSFHCLFPEQTDKEQLQQQGLLIRQGYQYHWTNQNYTDFDHYLSFFKSRKRKKARREREKSQEAGMRCLRLSGQQLEQRHWEILYEFYVRTFYEKYNHPSLTLDFFLSLASTMPENLMAVVAEPVGDASFIDQPQTAVAAAIFFQDETSLYGRYWGCRERYDALHFEVCFYQGIEYCIEQGLQRFEPGAQGEHKITRGFLPTETWSAHYIAHPGFRRGIEEFLARETALLKDHKIELDSMSPFRDPDVD